MGAFTLDKIFMSGILLVAFLRFNVHVKGVDGREVRCLPAKTEARPGSFILLPFPGNDGGNQNREVTNTECDTVLDGA